MKHPGFISLYRTCEELHRHYPTVYKWCKELGIALRRVGARGQYLTRTDFRRLAALNESRPNDLQYRQAHVVEDYHTEARTARDKELCHRIAAASRWKVAHHGAYIGRAEMMQIEAHL